MAHTTGVRTPPAHSRARRAPKKGPRRSEDTQIVRTLALLLALARSPRGVLLRQFAEQRGYPLAAVYRDRDALRRAGVPVDGPVDGARYVLAEAWLPPGATGATREEMLALFLARRLAPGLRGTRVARQLDSLWAKLAGPTGQPSLTFPDELGLSIPPLPAIEYAAHSVVIDLVATARRERRALWIRYRRGDGEESERVIEPGFLHWDGRLECLYVPSWCRLREAVRVFAVHRICDARLIDDTYAPRPQTRPAALEKAFQIWMRDQVERVAVQFSARVAGEIRERRRHATQRLVELADGGVVLHLEVAEPAEMLRWILGFGPDARVLEPAHLADRVRQQHAEAAALPPVTGAAPAAAGTGPRVGAQRREGSPGKAPAAAARRR
jgi:predicted DNA-binding transcriptional regulator YafY